MVLIQQIYFMQLILFPLSTGGKVNATVYQFPPFITGAEGESVTLNCAVSSEVNLSLIGTVQWTRGKPNGYKLDDSPFYGERLERSGSESFSNNRMYINISDLIEKDSDTYYCQIHLMQAGASDGNGTELEVRRRTEFQDPEICFAPVLWSALALMAVVIMIILACKLKLKCNAVSQNETSNRTDVESTYMDLELTDVNTYSKLHRK